MHRNLDFVRWDPVTVMFRRKSASVRPGFPEEVRTMEEFLEALKKGGMKPAYYEDGSYHILEVQEYGNGYPEIGF